MENGSGRGEKERRRGKRTGGRVREGRGGEERGPTSVGLHPMFEILKISCIVPSSGIIMLGSVGCSADE